ncbi:DUF4494 domain-containing protein [Anaerophaga thermohalophila]|uniref:DUF4494 domain-containing protein n=1 Tax=Anaerophaga thermohalophila TaxID=177400 RepID=UPI000237B942|nr:DUF4494 domain-containing protein [Anaerophaga thermohalophila]
MMHTWFECRVKYVKVDENTGKEKKVTEPYLVDAVSFTEAESRIHEEMQAMIRGEFQVTNIRKADYSDLFPDFPGDRWYKCKVSHLAIDENAGKEKKVTSQMLVMADNVRDAYDHLMKGLSDMVVDFQVLSITESPLMDVFPYDAESAFDGKTEKEGEEPGKTSVARVPTK